MLNKNGWFNQRFTEAHSHIANYSHQEELPFDYYEDKKFLRSLNAELKNTQMIGPELILGKLFDEIGFNKIDDDMFRYQVISRLVFPLSKLKTSEYMMRYQNISIDADQIYRYLDKLESQQKLTIQQNSFDHTLQIFDGRLSIVFYDVTTLYFETSNKDDLQKTGFSKDGKHKCSQIVLVSWLVQMDMLWLTRLLKETNLNVILCLLR